MSQPEIVKEQLRIVHSVNNGHRAGANGSPPLEPVEEWTEPEQLPEELLPVPHFDEILLPDAVRAFVIDASERMQAPVEFVACAIITAAASIIGNRIRIAPKRFDDWIVTPNLWAALVATPGKLKTPALQAGLVPLKKREQLAIEEHTEELKKFDFDRLEREAKREAVKLKLKEAAKKGESTEHFRAELEALPELDEPTVKSYIVNDATIEKLGVLLNRNPRGVLNFRDEIIGLLKTLDKEENANAKAFMLECWNGYGSYVFDRIGRGETRIENLTLSILGGIQPGVLAGYLRNAIAGGEFDDGFIQRFQLAFYPDAPKWKLIDRPPDNKAISQAHKCFAQLDNLSVEDGETIVLRFSDEAQEFFYKWWGNLESDIENGEFEHPALVAHFSKYRSLTPTLALIFHLFNVVAASRDVTEKEKVSLDAAMKAAAWCEILSYHARRIYGIAIRQETTLAKTILKKIRESKIKEQTTGQFTGRFTVRDIYVNE